ncbi:MAG: hydroxymethylbilane synthase, partial [Gemmatimonadales bacterium]
PPRHDPRDSLVCREPGVSSIGELPPGARVGTSSLRRVTQLRFLRPDVTVVPLRGNVPTRVRKVQSGKDYDAALLALAGLARLGLEESATPVDAMDVMPAPGQGALGLEIRAADRETRERLAPLADRASTTHVLAERALLAALGGGCQAPVAAYVETGETGHGKRLYGRVMALDGSAQLTASAEIDDEQPERAGEAVARLLESAGAASLLAR